MARGDQGEGPGPHPVLVPDRPSGRRAVDGPRSVRVPVDPLAGRVRPHARPVARSRRAGGAPDDAQGAEARRPSHRDAARGGCPSADQARRAESPPLPGDPPQEPVRALVAQARPRPQAKDVPGAEQDRPGDRLPDLVGLGRAQARRRARRLPQVGPQRGDRVPRLDQVRPERPGAGRRRLLLPAVLGRGDGPRPEPRVGRGLLDARRGVRRGGRRRRRARQEQGRQRDPRQREDRPEGRVPRLEGDPLLPLRERERARPPRVLGRGHDPADPGRPQPLPVPAAGRDRRRVPPAVQVPRRRGADDLSRRGGGHQPRHGRGHRADRRPARCVPDAGPRHAAVGDPRPLHRTQRLGVGADRRLAELRPRPRDRVALGGRPPRPAPQ